MHKSKIWSVLAGITLFSLVLAACAPAASTPQTIEVTKIVAGTPVVEQVVVTATPEPVATEPKVMVVCMAQEPSTLYTLSESALVKTHVLEAVYDWGIDTRTYDYQAIGIVELPTFDNGGADRIEVEVGVGDKVYDAAQDLVVTIEATTTATLNQLDGSTLNVDFAQTPTAKTVQLKVRWTLVDGITWEDNTPVTTADVIFAWDVASSPDSPNAKYTIERSESMVAVDDKTFEWTGAAGYTTGTYFLDAIVNPLPKHIYGEGGSSPMTPAEMLADESVNRDPLSFGPFKVDEWIAGDRIVLSKNPTYYRASEGLPHLDQLIYRFVPDTNQLIAQLASGECDLGTQDGAFEGSLPLIRQFEAQGLLKPQVVEGTTFEHLDFNILPVETYTGWAATATHSDGSVGFNNVEIRQAIAYCLDRQAIVDATTNGAGVLMNGYMPSSHPLYPGDGDLTTYPFDPAKGLELLAKNGWTDTDADGVLDNGQGVKFSFQYSTRTNALRQKVTQVVQEQLATNCQIETEIQLIGSEYFADGPDGLVFGRQYDMGEFAWLTGVEPPCSLYQGNQIPSEEFGWGASNNTGFSNAEFDAACVLASTTLDAAVKAEQHGIALKIFTENLPSIILFSRGKILVTGPNIEGVIMDPTANSELWNVENFDIVQQ